MNEFEWLRQTRDLRRPRLPGHDLWPGICARLEPRESVRRTRAWLPSGAAAAVIVLSIVLGNVALHTPPILSGNALVAQHWKPADPRLAGAAIEFQAADSEIRLAMRQAPDASFLQRIHQRMQAQQWRLQRYVHSAP